MAIAVRNEGSKVSSNINVTPMVDVMLVLLIIFMVITPMLQNKVQIDMAKVDNPTAMPDADKEDAIVVAITRDGGCLPGTEQDVASSELGVQVREKLADKPGKTILHSRRCPRAVPGGGRRHRRRAHSRRGRRGLADAEA